MSLGWIDPNDYSFNSFLLMERFQIRLLLNSCGWQNNKDEWKNSMGAALNANPAVRWYLERKCPECSGIVAALANSAPALTNAEEIRKAEVCALAGVEDFVIYTTPELMSEKCDFIRGWSKNRLYGLADFTDKVVLDVGSGSGRLAFAASGKARFVYASEPVDIMREYMRDKIKRGGIKNMKVLDGMCECLPFEDNSFDIVMSGHVLGDFWDEEIAEITRVCKPEGWLLNCPGDSERDMNPQPELTSRGWEEIRYTGSFGKDVYIHRKQIFK